MLKRIRYRGVKKANKLFAPTPECPSDCIVVLAVTGGKVHGWQTPDSYREGGIRYYTGTNFVFLTQETIDRFIPAHSESVDEETRERREDDERREEQEWEESQAKNLVGEVG